MTCVECMSEMWPAALVRVWSLDGSKTGGGGDLIST